MFVYQIPDQHNRAKRFIDLAGPIFFRGGECHTPCRFLKLRSPNGNECGKTEYHHRRFRNLFSISDFVGLFRNESNSNATGVNKMLSYRRETALQGAL